MAQHLVLRISSEYYCVNKWATQLLKMQVTVVWCKLILAAQNIPEERVARHDSLMSLQAEHKQFHKWEISPECRECDKVKDTRKTRTAKANKQTTTTKQRCHQISPSRRRPPNLPSVNLSVYCMSAGEFTYQGFLPNPSILLFGVVLR